MSLRALKNMVKDLKFGSLLGGNLKSRFEDRGAYNTVNTSYEALDELLPSVLKPDDFFVDVGCGKGRVINWLLSRGFKGQIVGIELDSSVAQKAAKRLEKYRNVSVLCGDAIELLPEDGSLLYLYNPFDEAVMRRFADKVEQCLDRNRVRIVYYNPQHLKVFLERSSTWKLQQKESPLLDHSVAYLQST